MLVSPTSWQHSTTIASRRLNFISHELLLEAVLAMPLQKMWMWTVGTSGRRNGVTGRIDECAYAILIVHLTGNQDF
jgi:hypothetical protein